MRPALQPTRAPRLITCSRSRFPPPVSVRNWDDPLAEPAFSVTHAPGRSVITQSKPLREVVEAEGHLIDSHIMERIFDTVVEYEGRFEVERFHIGRTNSEPSHLRLSIE